MTYTVLPPQQTGSKFTIIQVQEIAGLNTRDKSLTRMPDEFLSLQNIVLKGRGFSKRPGSTTFGTAQVGNSVAAIGALTQDSGDTPLMMVGQTLYKYVSGAWAASDKTNYTADLASSIVTMTSRSGSSLDSGTSSSGSTSYFVEDTSKTWTPGQWIGHCIVIQGEVKLITDNTATIVFLGDKLNSDDNTAYQSKAYTLYAVSPFAFIANGTDFVQKYDLTTTTPIDGTQVTNGKPLPKFSYLSVYQGRLIGSTATGDNNDRVFMMDQAIGENITTDTNLNVNLNFFNDGDGIVAHGPLPLPSGSLLLVAKNNSIHAVEGTNILNYTSRPIFTDLGCIAPKTFQIYGARAIWLSQRGVVSVGKDQEYLNAYTRALLISDEALPISFPIQDDIDAATDQERANATAAFVDHKYYLQIGTKCWYYDLEQTNLQKRNVWVDLSFPFAFNVIQDIDQIIYAGRQTSGQAYKLFTGTKDVATKVVMSIETADISLPGTPNVWLDRVELSSEAENSTVLKLQVSVDGGDYGDVITNTLNRADHVYTFKLGVRCKSFRLKITENGSQSPVRIHLPIQIYVNVSEFGDSGTTQNSLSPP